MSGTIYRVYWEERGNTENSGEANPASKEDSAHRICRIHDEIYPRYRHYFKKQEPKPVINEDK